MARVALALFLVVVTATALACQADSSAPSTLPLVGDWQLNLERTHYGPGVDRRRSERMTCTAEAEGVHCVIRSVRSDGRALTAEFTASLDGAPAPVSGIPDIDEVQLRCPSGSLMDATFLLHGTPIFGYRILQSDDGRSLTVVSVDPVTRVAGATVVVYDRQ